jgi:hypothetical protein
MHCPDVRLLPFPASDFSSLLVVTEALKSMCKIMKAVALQHITIVLQIQKQTRKDTYHFAATRIWDLVIAAGVQVASGGLVQSELVTQIVFVEDPTATGLLESTQGRSVYNPLFSAHNHMLSLTSQEFVAAEVNRHLERTGQLIAHFIENDLRVGPGGVAVAEEPAPETAPEIPPETAGIPAFPGEAPLARLVADVPNFRPVGYGIIAVQHGGTTTRMVLPRRNAMSIAWSAVVLTVFAIGFLLSALVGSSRVPVWSLFCAAYTMWRATVLVQMLRTSDVLLLDKDGWECHQYEQLSGVWIRVWGSPGRLVDQGSWDGIRGAKVHPSYLLLRNCSPQDLRIIALQKSKQFEEKKTRGKNI